MLRKFPILYSLAMLAVAAPLLCSGGRHALVLADMASAQGVDAEAVAAVEQAARQSSDSARQRGVPAENVVARILAVADDFPDVPGAGRPADLELAGPARRHAEMLREVLTFFR